LNNSDAARIFFQVCRRQSRFNRYSPLQAGHTPFATAAQEDLPMASGSFMLAAFLWTVGQAPSDVAYYSTRSLAIPMVIHPDKRGEISELRLFVSSDRGKNWPQEAVVSPDKDSFTFHAPADGEYWLRVAAVNKQGKQEPENIFTVPLDKTHKIIIDTLKPLVRIASAQRAGEEVTVAWEIQEEYPDLQSLKVEYRPADAPSGQWSSVPVGRQLVDQVRLRPGTSGPLLVRVEMKDLAGNVSFAQAEVPGPGGVTAASFKANSGESPVSANPPPPAPIETMSSEVKTAPKPEVKADSPPPTDPFPSSTSNAIVNPPSTPMSAPASSPAPPPVTVPPAAAPREPEAKVVARSDAAPTPRPPMAAAASMESTHNGLPIISRLVSSPRDVVLQYKLNKVGPSGIGSVELYLTDNDGHTWQRYAEDTAVSQLTAGGIYQRTIDLPDSDGVYGFRIVIKSRAGRGRPAPVAGEAPEMRIEVDTTKPEALLLEPRPDPKKRDALIIQWRVKDRNLDDHPITLEYADQPDGKWETIVANHPDTPSGYSWQVPQGKVSVYLRLRVRDKAGNEAVAVTSEPQLVDLSEPEGQLIDVTASPRQP
jgi:hypothetical protein